MNLNEFKKMLDQFSKYVTPHRDGSLVDISLSVPNALLYELEEDIYKDAQENYVRPLELEYLTPTTRYFCSPMSKRERMLSRLKEANVDDNVKEVLEYIINRRDYE